MIDMTREEALALLENSRVGRLAMVGADGRPYAIPLRYVWHNGVIYVRLAFDGRKQDALEHARRVCFETDQCEADFSYYASVLAEGNLIDVIGEKEKREALVAMNAKYERLAGLPTPGPNPVVQGVAMRKIVVEKLSGRKREPDVVTNAAPPRFVISAPIR
jgi:nitroimidazol reductase NimA-like FMN-containing flavoprotein (pyridoxamine 5'-phosphate oxidase superfamily)